MAKYVFYLFIIFLALLGIEFFGLYDVPVLEIPDWVSGTEEAFKPTTDNLDKPE